MDKPTYHSKFFSLALGIISFGGHLLGLISFGATYWADSSVYINLAYYLFHAPGLGGFYTAPMLCIASHVPLLPALLWGGIYQLVGNTYTWIIFASIQHGIAAVALLYLGIVLKKYLHPIIILFSSIVVVLLPMYQSFHNMVMTESLASSALLFLVAATLQMCYDRKAGLWPGLIFCLAGVIGIQARPQIILFAVVLLFCCTILYRAMHFKIAGLIMALLMVAYLAFPLARWAVLGKFFLPNIDCLTVRSALFATMGTNAEPIAKMLTSAKLSLTLDPMIAAQQGLTYEDIIAWQTALSQQGMSDAAIKATSQQLAWRIRFSSVSAVTSQLDAALTGLGMIHFSLFHRSTDILSEGLTRSAWTKHYQEHYIWLSWLDSSGYKTTFDDFISRWMALPANWYNPQALSEMHDTIRPHLTAQNEWRDPLHLAVVWPDLWAVGWLLCLIVLVLVHKKTVAVVLGVTTFVNYVVVLIVGFGNIRYVYLVLPLLVLSSGIGIGCLVQTVLKIIQHNRDTASR